MGCICSIIGTIVSNLLYFSQKFLYCFTCAAFVSCLVTTLFITLGMGIGIGYNYCFVDFKTRHRFVPHAYHRPDPPRGWYSRPRDYIYHYRRSNLPDNLNDLQTANSSNLIQTRIENETISHNNTNNLKQSQDNINSGTTERKQENKDQVTETNKETSTEKTIDDSPSMIIPISGLDLISLLSKLRSENKNYSLQIVTT